MGLAYSFFFCLSYVVPAYALIFHPSIEHAPENAQRAIVGALTSIQLTVQTNSVGDDDTMDDDIYLIATARDLFDDAENQEEGLSKSLRITTWIDITLTRCQLPLVTAIDRHS